MTTVATRPGEERLAIVGRPSPWRWQHAMAAIAVVYLAVEAWTIGAWLLAGPYQVTAFRQPDSGAWYAAKAFEAIVMCIAAGMTIYLVRQIRRERRFTFDAMLCVACALAYWQDPLINVFTPVLSYSSNFVNLTSWCSQVPMVMNTDCGRGVTPVVGIGLTWTFAMLLGAMMGGAMLRRLRAHYPGVSRAKQVLACCLFGTAFDIPFDFLAPMIHLWNFFAGPSWFTVGGVNHRFSLLLPIGAAIFFGGLVMVRNFRNDRNQTVFERGLDHLSRRQRTTLTFLSVVATMQLLATAANFAVLPMAWYADSRSELPSHVVNGVCDVGGFENTRYGPCPGPGFRAPLRSLPGESPPDGRRAEDMFTAKNTRRPMP